MAYKVMAYKIMAHMLSTPDRANPIPINSTAPATATTQYP